jgi:ABC-type multidrug transport system ATPase subunit
LRGLTKKFGETPVLENVSFTVAKNSVVGVVGENGAGKTTLFNIISRQSEQELVSLMLGGTTLH